MDEKQSLCLCASGCSVAAASKLFLCAGLVLGSGPGTEAGSADTEAEKSSAVDVTQAAAVAVRSKGTANATAGVGIAWLGRPALAVQTSC